MGWEPGVIRVVGAMRWSGVNKNEGEKGHRLNVGRGASDMPAVLGELVEPRSFSGGASKHPPLPSPQTTGRESSPRTGPLALPSLPQRTWAGWPSPGAWSGLHNHPEPSEARTAPPSSPRGTGSGELKGSGSTFQDKTESSQWQYTSPPWASASRRAAGMQTGLRLC